MRRDGITIVNIYVPRTVLRTLHKLIQLILRTTSMWQVLISSFHSINGKLK